MITYLEFLCKILEYERKGKKVVLGTGTFDLFHYEHLTYLQEAKEQGDILVVAVKNDKCAALKGEGRPIIEGYQRMAIVDSLKCVDYTIAVDYDVSVNPEIGFDNEKQKEWIMMFQKVFQKLRPDILYHEYNPVLQTARERVSEKYGIELSQRERREIVSTSKIIEKISKMKT